MMTATASMMFPFYRPSRHRGGHGRHPWIDALGGLMRAANNPEPVRTGAETLASVGPAGQV